MDLRLRRVTWWAAPLGLLGTLSLAFAPPLEAQSDFTRPLRLSVHGGVSQFDLSGTGTAPALAFRAAYAFNSVIRLEAGVGWSGPEQDFQLDRNSLWTPEVQVQFALPTRVSPYLGLGGGAAFETGWELGSGPGSRVSVSASGGVRVHMTRSWGLAGELRVRGIGGGFEASAAEWTLGLSRAF